MYKCGEILHNLVLLTNESWNREAGLGHPLHPELNLETEKETDNIWVRQFGQ